MSAQVWYGLLDAERNCRYFHRLADRLETWKNVLTFFVIVSSSGAATTLLAQGPEILSAILFVATVIASLALYIWDFSGKAAAARIFSDQYSGTALEWKRMWYQDKGLSRADIEALQDRELRIGLSETIKVDDKLNEKCAKEAYDYAQAEFYA